MNQSTTQDAGRALVIFFSLLGGLVVLALLSWGIYELGWATTQANVNHTDKIVNQSVANQSGLSANIHNNFQQLTSLQADERETPANKSFDQPQIVSTANDLCGQIPELVPAYQSTQWSSWSKANCSDGALSATSALRN